MIQETVAVAPGKTPTPSGNDTDPSDDAVTIKETGDLKKCRHGLMKETCGYCREHPWALMSVSYFPEAMKAPPRELLDMERAPIMSLPSETALDVILDSPNAPALIQSFPEGDLHLLVNEIGIEDALPLLAMASDEQWSYMLDMEAWDGDQISPASSINWIDHLLKADPERFTGSFLDGHLEDIELYIFKNMKVNIAGQYVDPDRFDSRWDTFDGKLYFRFVDPPQYTGIESYIHNRESILTRFLERLSEQDHSRYLEIMMEAASIMPSETEEQAYRLRNERLAEKGLVPPEEAIGIYQPLRPGDIEALTGSQKKAALPVESPFSSTLPALQADRSGHIFGDAMALVSSEEIMLRIQEELAGLANRIISADRLRIRERGQLDAVIEKATGYIGIGIESIGGRDGPIGPRDAADLLERYPLSMLFRLGYGRALRLKTQARQWHTRSWPVTRGLSDSFWGEEFQGVLEGLLIDRPLFYCRYQHGGYHREFADLSDIRVTRRALQDLTAVDTVLSRLSIGSLSDVHDPIRPYSYKNLLLTLWARNRLGLSDTLSPIPMSAFMSLLKDLWLPTGRQPIVKPSMKVSFLVWVSHRIGSPYREAAKQLGGVTDNLFDDVLEECGYASVHHLDPQSVELFLLKS